MTLQKALLLSSLMAIVGSLLKVTFGFSFQCILLGKGINGFSTGVMYFLYGKCLNETIPNHLLATYSIFPFLISLLGVLAEGWVGYILPATDTPI